MCVSRRDLIRLSALATSALALPALADTRPSEPMRLLILGEERLVDNGHPGLDNPFFRIQISAGRTAFEQSKLGEQQCARALRSDQLTLRIEPYLREEFRVFGNNESFHAAADDHR